MRTYHIGGGWGDRISWYEPREFETKDLNKDVFRVLGWTTPRPSPGDLLVGEFEKSVITFAFVEVKYEQDPDDMFLANVKAISQEKRKCKT